jgi:uroporphyrinogen decarboxylase
VEQDMQNSRALVDNLMRKRPAERIGLHDSTWNETRARWVAEGYPTDAQGNAVNPEDHFGYDMCGAGGWFDYMPLRGFSEVVEESEEWRVTRNGAGAAFKYWKNKSGTPEHVDFRMSSRQIWERDYRSPLLEVDRARMDIAGTKQAREKRQAENKWAFYGHLFIWEVMRSTMGDLCLYESLALDPGWIHDFCRVYTDFYKAHYKIIFEEAGLPDGIWVYEDLGYNKGLFCSPRTLEDLIFPYFKELVDFFHSYDLTVVLHSCGNITDALPLMVDAGFDGLNPMEVKAGCELLKFAEKYADRLAFVGGLDVRIMESGDRDLMKKEITRIMSAMKALGASYLFGSDHSLTPRISYADYQYCLQVYRDNMMY